MKFSALNAGTITETRPWLLILPFPFDLVANRYANEYGAVPSLGCSLAERLHSARREKVILIKKAVYKARL